MHKRCMPLIVGIIWVPGRWSYHDRDANTIVLLIPRRIFKLLPYFTLMTLWYITWSTWCQACDELSAIPGSYYWPFHPDYRVVRDCLLLKKWCDLDGYEYNFFNSTFVWPWDLGQMVSHFCRLARLYDSAL